nr:helix-turn-helix transcriptional regulator [uncultured Cupriavidus sp.]
MTSTAFRAVSYSGRYTDLPPDFARCVLNAGLHVAVVDGVLTHEERRCTWFDRHVSLALMVEGAGHYQVEGATDPCEYQPGSCYLSCAWEKARGDDVFPAHIRRRIVLLQYCADWLSLFERGGYPHPAGGVFHGHPWRAAWVVRMPMPVELRQLAEDLLAHGAPEDPLARLKTESRALAALVTLAETLQDGHSHDPTAADTAPAEGGESRALTGRERRLLCTARSYIQTHCLESISVTGVANAVGLGEAALQNGFRALFGSTVYDYVLERRLAEAARLLREGAMSIGDVAWRSGFSHASHLARHFRRRYGMSPRDYRVR